MHTVHIHIDEMLGQAQLENLEQALMHRPYVAGVAYSNKSPHDLLVDYDAHHIHPIDILQNIAYAGLHTDVTYC